MAKRSEGRTRLLVGLFVVILLAVALLSLFTIGQSEGSWKSKTTIRTDFRTIAGLRKGSPVQLAGVKIGRVQAINFVQRTYTCDPLTEDVGRWGAGRTDDCDPFLFCSPKARCAELEPYASRALHAPCLSAEDCAEEEICVTKEFRRRARRVHWTGPHGVCARYSTEHQRVEVEMTIFADKLEIIRTDSSATVASNGVLGDQLVNITPGSREPLGDDRRIQSTPSLYEDIELFRDRIDGLTNKVDDSLSGISALFSQLNDESTIASVKGTIRYLEEILRQIAEAEGLVGALVSDEEYKEELGKALRGVRNTARGADQFMEGANRSLARIDENLEPAIEDARKVLAELSHTLEELKDPQNESLVAKLLYDEDGRWADDLEQTLAHAKEATQSAAAIAAKIESGEGTVGKLVNDSKPHDDLVKILQNLERNDTFKRLTRYVIELQEGQGEGGETAKKE